MAVGSDEPLAGRKIDCVILIVDLIPAKRRVQADHGDSEDEPEYERQSEKPQNSPPDREPHSLSLQPDALR
jgi:hypothetical protein